MPNQIEWTSVDRIVGTNTRHAPEQVTLNWRRTATRTPTGKAHPTKPQAASNIDYPLATPARALKASPMGGLRPALTALLGAPQTRQTNAAVCAVLPEGTAAI